MSKAIEYNEKIIKKQHKKTKEYTKKYFNKKCSLEELEIENIKLFKKYINLEKIISDELNNFK